MALYRQASARTRARICTGSSAATIDVEHDEADRGRKLEVPVLASWGEHGFVHQAHDVLEVWPGYAADVRGQALPAGHDLAEEAPLATSDLLVEFLRGAR